MKKRVSLAFFIVLMVSFMIGCTGKDSKETSSESAVRTITDLAGNTVEIPAAKDIDKVVIIAPPLVPAYTSVVKEPSKLTGMSGMVVNNANKELLEQVLPDYKNISTSFLNGFVSNTEEVLNLDPDIILVYGDSQKQGLENIGIPVVDFYITDQENEAWSVKVDQLMRKIFEVSDKGSLEEEWADSNKIAKKALDQISDSEKKTGLMIMSNTDGKVTVRGTGTYGDDWLTKSGLKNAAQEVQGESVEVSMEQIYKWNPDIIYIFRGGPAASYIANSISGQDWMQVKACKNGAVYDMPIGMFNWGSPNVDSPLTLQWMIMKNYDGLISETEFEKNMKEFYQRQYGISLDEGLMESILNPYK